jgi:hypothetical protein
MAQCTECHGATAFSNSYIALYQYKHYCDLFIILMAIRVNVVVQNDTHQNSKIIFMLEVSICY